MRQVTFVVLATLGTLAGRAHATPFEPGTVPDQVDAVGHLDADALRKTQIFALGGQKVIDEAVDEAPSELRPLVRSIAGTARGVSFWHEGEHGAIYLETRDARALAQLLAKAPVTRGPTVDGIPTFIKNKPDKPADKGCIAAVGDTLVLADTPETLERSIHVLGGKAPSLAGSSKLPAAARSGVFVFVTIGSDALSAIQKTAHAKVLQLAIRTIAIDVGEASGVVTATAHAEMANPDAVQKAKSILDGLHALGSLSDDPAAKTLLDGITITTTGLAVDVVAKLPVAELAKLTK